MFIFPFWKKDKSYTKKIKVKDGLSTQYNFCNCFVYSYSGSENTLFIKRNIQLGKATERTDQASKRWFNMIQLL